MADPDRWTRPRRGSGLLLALFIAAALAVPLWLTRGQDHPLAGMPTVDLCAGLHGIPALDGLTMDATPAAGAAGQCQWRDADGRARLDAMLTTTRSASTTQPTRIARLFDAWRDEIGAFGVSELQESGEEGARTLSYLRGATRELLIEDRGVLLWLRSPTMEADAFAALEAPARAALRAEPTATRD